MASPTPVPFEGVFVLSYFSGNGYSSVRIVHLTGEHFGIIIFKFFLKNLNPTSKFWKPNYKITSIRKTHRKLYTTNSIPPSQRSQLNRKHLSSMLSPKRIGKIELRLWYTFPKDYISKLWKRGGKRNLIILLLLQKWNRGQRSWTTLQLLLLALGLSVSGQRWWFEGLRDVHLLLQLMFSFLSFLT